MRYKILETTQAPVGVWLVKYAYWIGCYCEHEIATITLTQRLRPMEKDLINAIG